MKVCQLVVKSVTKIRAHRSITVGSYRSITVGSNDSEHCKAVMPKAPAKDAKRRQTTSSEAVTAERRKAKNVYHSRKGKANDK